MASIFSSLLRAVNRSKDMKFNILCSNKNEVFQTMLARTGHNFFFLQSPNEKAWNTKTRSLPSNCILLKGKGVKEQLKQEIQFDFILCQDRQTQFPYLNDVARQISCPIIMAENSFTPSNINPSAVEALTNQPYNLRIFHSELLANSWSCEPDEDTTEIIPYGIDTDFFQGWSGGDGKVLSIVNNYRQRNQTKGFEIWTEVTKGLSTNLVGDNKGMSSVANNVYDLLSQYQNASVFLNTSTWSSCPKTVLEAMSVGCPVVTTATTILPDIIENGVNGYVSYENEELRALVMELLSDPDKARELGKNARKTIIDKFGLDNFATRWNNVLGTNLGKASSAIICA